MGRRAASAVNPDQFPTPFETKRPKALVAGSRVQLKNSRSFFPSAEPGALDDIVCNRWVWYRGPFFLRSVPCRDRRHRVGFGRRRHEAPLPVSARTPKVDVFSALVKSGLGGVLQSLLHVAFFSPA